MSVLKKAILCLLACLLLGGRADIPAKQTDWSNCAQYIRISYVAYDMPLENAVIHSAAELAEYYEQHQSCYDNGQQYYYYHGEFLNACSKYDDTFFASKNLLIIYRAEGSGSVRHELAGIAKRADGKWKVVVNRICPEVGTCDMAAWLILIEADKAIDTMDDVVVDFT